MNKQVKTFLQLFVGIGIAAGLLYLTFRNSSWEDISRLQEADPLLLVLGAAALFMMYMFRAWRWSMMLKGAGHPAKLFNIVLATLITYLVNSLTPKLGEILRCSVLLKTDKVPVSASLGTVVSERVADVLFLFGGVGIIFLLELDRLGALFSSMAEKILGDKGTEWFIGIGVVLVIGAGVGFYFLRSSRFQEGLIGKVQAFLNDMLDAAKSVFRLERPWLFILHTIGLWACLVLMNYLFLLALPETSDLGWYMAILILFIGGLGWALPVPGGMGTTHFIIWQLFLAFELSETAGKNAAILSNGATLIYNVFFGILAWFIFLWIAFRIDQAQKSKKTSGN
ncbi:MAG: lysylphosphatidylglycerol synthase transmembrane domain-containing protein [Bacteroidota bacterium]